jgi:non-ribosomal peptide synthetase component E (peptide arylation enzyme)
MAGDTRAWPDRVADPSVLADLVARDRRTSAPALVADGPDRRYTYHDFITTSYKAGNVLRYLGVRTGDRVGIEPDGLPEPVLTFYGAAQLGAVTDFRPDERADVRAVVVPVCRETDFELPPGSNLAVYGGPPTDPTTTHWEKEVWSENPAVHPATVAPDDAVLDADRTYTHAELLRAAETALERANLSPGDEVVVRESLTTPRVVAAGLVAPLLAGATIVFPDEDTVGDVRVGDGPESRAIPTDSPVL